MTARVVVRQSDMTENDTMDPASSIPVPSFRILPPAFGSITSQQQQQLRLARTVPNVDGLLQFIFYHQRQGSATVVVVKDQGLDSNGNRSNKATIDESVLYPIDQQLHSLFSLPSHPLSQWDEWMAQYHIWGIDSKLTSSRASTIDTLALDDAAYSLPRILKAAKQCHFIRMKWQQLARHQQQTVPQGHSASGSPLSANTMSTMASSILGERKKYQDCLSHSICQPAWKLYFQCYTNVTERYLPTLIAQQQQQQQLQGDSSHHTSMTIDDYINNPQALSLVCLAQRQQLEQCVGRVVSQATHTVTQASNHPTIHTDSELIYNAHSDVEKTIPM
jgi:hypothetical protein